MDIQHTVSQLRSCDNRLYFPCQGDHLSSHSQAIEKHSGYARFTKIKKVAGYPEEVQGQPGEVEPGTNEALPGGRC